MNAIQPLSLQDQEAAKTDNDFPQAQNVKLGSRVQTLEQRALYIQKVAIAAAANVTPVPVVAEVTGEIVDAWAVGNAASASGTVTLRTATPTAITSAIVMAVQDALARTASIAQALKNVTAGQALNAITNGANDRGFLYIAILRA